MAAYVLVPPCYSANGTNPAANGNAGASVPCDPSQSDCVDNAGVPCSSQGEFNNVIQAEGYPLTGQNATPAAAAVAGTGAISASGNTPVVLPGAAAPSTNSGSSIASLLSSFGQIGVSAYSATQTPPTSKLNLGGLSLQAPTGSTTILIVAVVGIIAIIFLRKK